MFNLFSGKYNGALSLALQGISQAVGFITKVIIAAVDHTVEAFSSISTPLTDKITAIPIIGETLNSVVETVNHVVGGVSNTVNDLADDLLAGNLEQGVDRLLDNATTLVGHTVNDASDVLDNVLDLISPVTAQLSQVPVLGPIVHAADQALNNLSGLVDETGDYVGAIDPVALVSSTLQNPVAGVGGVVQDVSSTLDALLGDIAPITTTLEAIPVAGGAVTLVGETVTAINNGLYGLGTQLTTVNPLNLELTNPFPFV